MQKDIKRNYSILERVPHAKNISQTYTIPEQVQHIEEYNMSFHNSTARSTFRKI